MKNRGETDHLPATISCPRPADFPLGSLESRAAVRALLTTQGNKAKMSRGDIYPPGWSPKTAAQEAALESSADILFFGGAATAIQSIRKTDLIFIPTTGLSLDDVVERNAPVVPWLKKWHKRGAAIASVCSGVGLVAATGMLDGKRATTHWALAERFREKYPRVKWMPELMVTEDRGFYCGGGVHAALDLSLYLVEQFCGHDVAMESSKALLIETPRAWQAGFAVVPLKTEHKDDAISVAQDWLHENFHRPFPLEAPARRAGMSLRNFVRRFKQATGDSPLAYLQKLRVAAAKRLLENNHRTMQEISDAVGYQDVAFFRALFQHHTGMSPSAYRERFGVH